MKTLIACFFLFLPLFGGDAVDEEIQTAPTIDDLTTRMNRAPKQYRHRYIQAIKERSAYEAQAKRKSTLEALEKSKEEIATEHINALGDKDKQEVALQAEVRAEADRAMETVDMAATVMAVVTETEEEDKKRAEALNLSDTVKEIVSFCDIFRFII